MRPCMGVVGFRMQFYRLSAASYMRARTKAPAAPGSVFDSFPLLYVLGQMLQYLIILGIHLLYFIFQCIVVHDIWHKQH